MPILTMIEEAAIGCWMLVRGNAAGAERFDLSLDGFWRSFRWAYLLAICDALDALAGHYQTAAGDDATGAGITVWLLVISAVASLVTFFSFPVIVGALARPMGLSKRYATYIIARNWLTVFASLPVYVIDFLTAIDAMPEELRDLLVIAIVIVTLFAGTQIAYKLIATTRSLAFGFALLDFLLALLIGEAASRLIA